MTRKETLKRFKTWCQNNIGNHCSDENFQMANNIMALLELEPCKDAISREQAIDAVADLFEISEYPHPYPQGKPIRLKDIKEKLKQLPSVQSKPKTGYWIPKTKNWWECSECGCMIYSETEADKLKFHAFCGKCGIRMIDPQEGENE